MIQTNLRTDETVLQWEEYTVNALATVLHFYRIVLYFLAE